MREAALEAMPERTAEAQMQTAAPERESGRERDGEPRGLVVRVGVVGVPVVARHIDRLRHGHDQWLRDHASWRVIAAIVAGIATLVNAVAVAASAGVRCPGSRP